MKKTMRFDRVAVAALSCALAGCGSPSVIHRTFNMGNSEVQATTGSAERIITNHRPNLSSRPGLIDPIRVVCAEPSPDVAMAVANSLNAGLSIFGKGSASLSAQEAQGLVQLAERTAALQLLQMQTYRACEAYSNGAITGTTYSLLMSRLYETMVTLSLSDTAGGGVGRSLASVGGNAEGDSKAEQMIPAFVKDLSDALAKLTEAKEKVEKAQTELDKAQADLKAGSATQATVDEKKAARDKAVAERDTLRTLLQTTIAASASGKAAVQSLTAGGGLAHKPDEKIAGVLRDMQKNFLDRQPMLTYIDACLVELGMAASFAGGQENEIVNSVQQYIGAALTGNPKTGAQPGDFQPVFRLLGQMRRTGLYDSCKNHLVDLLQREQADRVALRTLEHDVTRKMVATRDTEARAALATSLEKGFAACNKYETEAARVQCQVTFRLLAGEPSTALEKTLDRFLATRPKIVVVPEEFLPTVSFDAAKKRLPAVTKARTELTALSVPAAKDKIFPEAERAALQGRKEASIAALNQAIGDAAILADAELARLAAREKERARILGDLRRAEDDRLLRERYDAELHAHAKEMRYEDERFNRLTKALAAAVSDAAAVGGEIRKANDKVK